MSETRPSVSTAKKAGLAHRLYTGDLSYDFVRNRNRWYVVSAILLLVSLGALLFRGLDLGIEFRGGSDYQAKVQVTEATVGDFRQAVQSSGVPNLNPVVTTIGNDRVRVQVRSLSVPEQTTVRAAIAKKAGVETDQVAYQLIGASWGKQITQQAAIALVVFLVLVGGLIWIYFRDWKMSVAALVALLHDLIVTVGIYAVVGFTVTPATMIGILTILGYSLYDTVVVFDKVRENVAELETRRVTYSEAANNAVNQVLIRSLNTTIIGVLPVAALLFAGVVVLGTGPLEDLGLALFVGMVAGAYSSIFIATPLLAQLKEREPAMAEHRTRLERRRARVAVKDASTAESSSGAPTSAVSPVLSPAVVMAPSPATGAVRDQLDAEVPPTAGAAETTPRAQPKRAPRSQRK
jgi:preprotein translocase subunit SecF